MDISRHLTPGLMSADPVQLLIGLGLIVVFLALWAWYEYQG